MFLMEEEGKGSCHQCGCVMYVWESWREDFVEREQLFAVGESCRHFKWGNLGEHTPASSLVGDRKEGLCNFVVIWGTWIG